MGTSTPHSWQVPVCPPAVTLSRGNSADGPRLLLLLGHTAPSPESHGELPRRGAGALGPRKQGRDRGTLGLKVFWAKGTCSRQRLAPGRVPGCHRGHSRSQSRPRSLVTSPREQKLIRRGRMWAPLQRSAPRDRCLVINPSSSPMDCSQEAPVASRCRSGPSSHLRDKALDGRLDPAELPSPRP